MNKPFKHTGEVNSKGESIYTGDITPIYDNRKKRREYLQKSARNPMFGLSRFTHFIQKVFNKKKNRTITIIHQK